MSCLRTLLVPALALATALIPLPAAHAAPPEVAAPRDSRAEPPVWTPPLLLPNLVPAKAQFLVTPMDDEMEFVWATVRMRNMGTWFASSSKVRTELRVDGVLVRSWHMNVFGSLAPATDVPLLLAGWTRYTNRRQTYELRVILDATNQVIESSETDNVTVFTKTL